MYSMVSENGLIRGEGDPGQLGAEYSTFTTTHLKVLYFIFDTFIATLKNI